MMQEYTLRYVIKVPYYRLGILLHKDGNVVRTFWAEDDEDAKKGAARMYAANKDTKGEQQPTLETIRKVPFEVH